MNGLEQLGPVAAVLGLLCLMLWLFQSRGMLRITGIRLDGLRGDRQREMQCMERIALTPQHSLHLVRVKDRTLVIGVAPSGCTLIQDFGNSQECQIAERGSRS
jgi:flagellar biogenesis protein FliO